MNSGFINKAKHILLYPFEQGLLLLVGFWLFASFADVFFLYANGSYIIGLYKGMLGLLQCYLLVLLSRFLKGTINKIFVLSVAVLGVINVIADSFVYSITKDRFSLDTVAIILGSNLSEATEFIPMYLTTKVLLFILINVLLAVLAITFYYRKVNRNVSPVLSLFLSVTMILSLFYSIHRRFYYVDSVFLNKFVLFATYSSPVNLQEYRKKPMVLVNGEQPELIMLVIGESLSKNHCSLYGYNKLTMPILGQMVSDSIVITYDNVKAPYTHTIEAFKAIMSTYKTEYQDDKWYEYPFLIDYMKAAGYRTCWVSNQSSVGVYDNVISKYAELSDTVILVGKTKMGLSKNDYDELVLPYLSSLIFQDFKNQKLFIVVHLMGSHESFEVRYPASFSRFTSNDYQDCLRNQRKILADYDNSVLYNDYVVSSIINLVTEENVILYYFPDHSLDVFETDAKYAGHARLSDSLSVELGLNIPFILFQSDKNKKTFSESYSRHVEECHNAFCTEDIVYELIDVANITVLE
ncbi:MAG: phosphoethanolamine transferase [Bacteroidaceae bacterium]|nr:phosphoethanolamine transferase [Bacteroidaceae bacterium]